MFLESKAFNEILIGIARFTMWTTTTSSKNDRGSGTVSDFEVLEPYRTELCTLRSNLHVYMPPIFCAKVCLH